MDRFVERGVERENIYTYQDIKESRRRGYEEWAERLARPTLDGDSPRRQGAPPGSDLSAALRVRWGQAHGG
jgi:hypothetical protein